MDKLQGKSVFGGIAIGKVCYFKPTRVEITDEEVADIDAELSRFQEARENAIKQQNDLYEKALAEAGEESAEVFSVHAMMLEDDDLVEQITAMIRDEHKNAKYAVERVCRSQAEVFYSMDDAYMKERGTDIIDIGKEMLFFLSGEAADANELKEQIILVAEDLTPSDTVRLNKDLLLGFVTKKGSENSHTAILARNMGIPAIVQCDEVSEAADGQLAIIDGENSTFYISPTEEILERYNELKGEALKRRKALEALKGVATETIEGRRINLYANIGSPNDLKQVFENDAEGIGLFRSEFVYLNSKDYPTEDAQFEAYKKVLEEMAPKKVIIRTCDIGADKTVDYMGLEPEENPAMGLRAVRISLSQVDLFKTQLKALLRASACGNLGIMFPMITSTWELKRCKELLEECKKELDFEKKVYSSNIEIGTMIETPAAVFIADELAKECDFFSIGTNDLTQYICAIDRQNPHLEAFTDTHHPAILKAIEMTVKAAHDNDCWVGICGELASDMELTEYFCRIGVDELSVNAGMILPIREKIRTVNLTGKGF